MTTYVFTKEVFLKSMKELVKDKEYVILTSSPEGEISACSKRRKYKRISFGFASGVFDKPETISDILRSRIFGLIVGNKDILSKKILEEMEENKKQKKLNEV